MMQSSHGGSRCSVFQSDDEEMAEMENISSSLSSKDGKREVRIVVMGMSGVGKTALTVRYTTKRYIGDYDSHSEAIYTHQTTVDGKEVTFYIMDTSGQRNIDEFRSEQIRWGDGFILVYDVTDAQTFTTVKDMFMKILEVKGKLHVPVAVLGNKCDLLHRRVIDVQEVSEWTRDQSGLFFEVSASEGEGFDSISFTFSEIYREIRVGKRRSEKLIRLLQKPSVASKLEPLRQSLRNLTEMKWRNRTGTM